MNKHYVLTWRSDIAPGSIGLTGPFEDEDKAAVWGEGWQIGHGDNPCWQVLALDGDNFANISEYTYALVKVAQP